MELLNGFQPSIPKMWIRQLFVLDPRTATFENWRNDWAGERDRIYLQFAKEAKRTDLLAAFLERKAYYVKHNNQQQAARHKATEAATATIMTTEQWLSGSARSPFRAQC